MLTKSDIRQIDTVVSKRITREIKPVKRDIGTIKSDAAQIRKDVKTLVNYFDREYLELRARIERIETHLQIEPSSS